MTVTGGQVREGSTGKAIVRETMRNKKSIYGGGGKEMGGEVWQVTRWGEVKEW